MPFKRPTTELKFNNYVIFQLCVLNPFLADSCCEWSDYFFSLLPTVYVCVVIIFQPVPHGLCVCCDYFFQSVPHSFCECCDYFFSPFPTVSVSVVIIFFSPFPTVAEAVQESLEAYRTQEEEVKRLKSAMVSQRFLHIKLFTSTLN